VAAAAVAALLTDEAPPSLPSGVGSDGTSKVGWFLFLFLHLLLVDLVVAREKKPTRGL